MHVEELGDTRASFLFVRTAPRKLCLKGTPGAHCWGTGARERGLSALGVQDTGCAWGGCIVGGSGTRRLFAWLDAQRGSGSVPNRGLAEAGPRSGGCLRSLQGLRSHGEWTLEQHILKPSDSGQASSSHGAFSVDQGSLRNGRKLEGRQRDPPLGASLLGPGKAPPLDRKLPTGGSAVRAGASLARLGQEQPQSLPVTAPCGPCRRSES